MRALLRDDLTGRCSKVSDWTVLPERPATLYSSVEAFKAVGKRQCFRRARSIRRGNRALTVSLAHPTTVDQRRSC